MKQPNASRAIKKLEELGVIIRGEKIGRISTWRLNPNAGWKGKVKGLRPALEAVEPKKPPLHEYKCRYAPPPAVALRQTLTFTPSRLFGFPRNGREAPSIFRMD